MTQTEQTGTTTTTFKKRDDHSCWRCGSHNYVIWDRIVSLIGGFCAQICADCRNDWDVYIREHPVRVNLDHIQIATHQTHAKTFHDGQDRTLELLEYAAKERRVKAELFAIGETWVSDVIERPAPPPPPPPTEQELQETRERRKKRLQAQLAMIEREDQAKKELNQ